MLTLECVGCVMREEMKYTSLTCANVFDAWTHTQEHMHKYTVCTKRRGDKRKYRLNVDLEVKESTTVHIS